MMMKTTTMRQALLLSATAALLSGCSLFSSSTAPKPAVLEQLSEPSSARVLWSGRIEGSRPWVSMNSVKSLVGLGEPESERLLVPLSMAVAGDRFVVANADGYVQALRAADGVSQWQADVGQRLSAGVGSDGRFAAVVTRNNELVVIDGGQQIWRKTLPTPVNTAPLVAGERVFVLTVDRQVLAFDALDGRKLWELRRPGEPLTLAQPGVIGAYKDTLIVGQGPRLAGVDPLKGTLRWEANVANPRGTNEVERLADLVGPLLRSGESLCARGFQSAVGCVNAERGSALWSRNVGGTKGIGGDAQLVFGADGSDRLSAWKMANGDTAWVAEQFQNRKLSAPLSLGGKTVLVGDFEGYVHIVSRDTGKTVGRLATDGSPIVASPVAIGDTALVLTRNGGFYAIKPE